MCAWGQCQPPPPFPGGQNRQAAIFHARSLPARLYIGIKKWVNHGSHGIQDFRRAEARPYHHGGTKAQRVLNRERGERRERERVTGGEWPPQRRKAPPERGSVTHSASPCAANCGCWSLCPPISGARPSLAPRAMGASCCPPLHCVAQPSSAAGSSTGLVRVPWSGGETPPQPAGEDACATGGTSVP